MHFEMKMHKIIFFSRKKICLPTLPKIFRPVTRNTLIFLFGPTDIYIYRKIKKGLKVR